MKNFIRLLRFAWPYRWKFGLSLGCAVMVAILWFANIGAVYPLLQILFYHQNTQRWVAEQIEESDTNRLCIEARLAEISELDQLAKQGVDVTPELRGKYRRLTDTIDGLQSKIRMAEQAAQDKANLEGPNERPVAADTPFHRELEVAQSQLDEVRKSTEVFRRGSLEPLHRRQESLGRDLTKEVRNGERLRWLEPWIHRFLPDDGFRTLLLLMVVVMCGVALKGVFTFLQDVLVASVTQLCLFDIRNLFFRRTMALDLESFSDQGSAELMARFTNDVESVAQGFNTVLSQHDPRTVKDRHLLGRSALAQLAANVSDTGARADFGGDDVQGRQGDEAGRQAFA